MRFCHILMLMLALLFTSNPASADEDVCSGEKILNVPQFTQAEPVWCWVTTTQMVLKYRNGWAPFQCQLIEVAKGLPAGTCCNNPGLCQISGQSMSSIGSLLSAFGRSSYYTGVMTAEEVWDELSNGNPIVVQYASGMTATHVVVIRAMRWQAVNNQCVPFIGINDPLAFFSSWVPFSKLQSSYWIDSLVVE